MVGLTKQQKANRRNAEKSKGTHPKGVDWHKNKVKAMNTPTKNYPIFIRMLKMALFFVGVHSLNHKDLHKSHTGYIIYFGSSPIHAKSKKQTVVCDNSSYAELIAMHMMNYHIQQSVFSI